MAKNISAIPYTELCERAAEISRSGSENDRPTVRGTVNDVATKEIGAKFDWSFLKVSSSITCERSEERRVGKECRSRWSPYH